MTAAHDERNAMSARENDGGEQAMIPHDLVPRQRSDDPILTEEPAATQGGIDGDRPVGIDADRPVERDHEEQEERDDDSIELDELP